MVLDADNVASRRVAEKAGFVEAGAVEDTSWSGALSTRLCYVRPVDRSSTGTPR
jgi:RimJ/RimL family protein N-acetyltransferase